MRWLWIDKFVEFRSGEFARALKTVSMAEEPMRDHFPAYPVMPNSLIIEGMAQTGGILVGEAQEFKRLVILAKLSRVDFTDSALPGDQLVYETTLTELRAEGSAVAAKALVNGRPLATAEIVYFHVDRSGAAEELNERQNSYRQELMQVLCVPARAASAGPLGAHAPVTSTPAAL